MWKEPPVAIEHHKGLNHNPGSGGDGKVKRLESVVGE
jgi:hypothetical protein